jgi:long-chain acyl-CoA synthetase
MNVYDIIEDSARLWPIRPAIIDEYGYLDYQSLHEQIETIRERLSQIGVRRGQSVGVMGPNSRAFIISVFASLGCGATVLPISPQLKEAEVESLIETTDLCAIIYDNRSGRLLENTSVSKCGLGFQDMQFAWTGAGRNKPFRNIMPDAAFVRYTSGTTGVLKGVVLSHTAVLERIEAANKGLKLSCDDAVLWVLPMAFHFFVSIVLYLRYGVTIIISPDHFAETILELSNKHNATFLYASPLHYRLLAANTSAQRFATLRSAVSTSASLPVNIALDFAKRFGRPITQAYGIIEVGLPLMNIDSPLERPDSIGKPLPDYKVALFDDGLNSVTDESIGQLAIKGPGMFDAYLNPLRCRNDVLHDGWFLTGDLACRDKAGFVTIVGRCKAMINVGGNKVFPEEVEAVINQHPAVANSKVSALSHPQLGEVVSAVIVKNKKQKHLDVEEIETFCRARLSSFKVPQSFRFVDTIEETPSGKTLRR